MDIIIVEKEISLEELKELAKKFYGEMIKGVVDIEKEMEVQDENIQHRMKKIINSKII